MMEEVLLSLHDRPKTLSQLAHDLGVGAGLVQTALQQLQRGKYIQEAHPEDCGPPQQGKTVCGNCSMNSLCSNADAPKKEANPSELWRLTAKGEQRMAPRPGYQALPLS